MIFGAPQLGFDPNHRYMLCGELICAAVRSSLIETLPSEVPEPDAKSPSFTKCSSRLLPFASRASMPAILMVLLGLLLAAVNYCTDDEQLGEHTDG